MGKFFDIDSPLMHALSKLADIMWLNILTLIFATPLILEQILTIGSVFIASAQNNTNVDLFSYEFKFYALIAFLGGLVACIPLGPALTAMHYVLLKIVRDEDSYVTKAYFKSFKENFKQGAVLQLIQFGIAGILFFDFLIMGNKSSVYFYIVIAVFIILYMVSLYVFPLLSKFVNTVPGTLKNAGLMAVLALPKTLLMAIASAIPLLILYFFDFKALPVLILLGIAGPGFLCALLYNNTFKRFEPKEEELSEEEELEAAIKKIDDSEQ